MRKFFASVFVLVSLAVHAVAQIADGDALYARRGEGAQGARASAAMIEQAIAAYQRAAQSQPNDLEARWKLMRALRYKGAYVVTDPTAKKQVFAQAKNVGNQAMAILDRQLAAKGVRSVAKASEKQIADAARSIPHAGSTFYWDAVNWGEWALAYGKMAAVREGAADRIKRGATITMMIDPKIEEGGGARVLGRLHNQTPRVPFVTGWASDDLAVRYLKQALSHDPRNKLTKVFLAEAMVAADGKSRNQAVQMLREVIQSPNDPEYVVENVSAQNDARELLDRWGVK